MVDEKLIIAELVKAVKEKRITLEQVKTKLQEENKIMKLKLFFKEMR